MEGSAFAHPSIKLCLDTCSTCNLISSIVFTLDLDLKVTKYVMWGLKFIDKLPSFALIFPFSGQIFEQ